MTTDASSRAATALDRIVLFPASALTIISSSSSRRRAVAPHHITSI